MLNRNRRKRTHGYDTANRLTDAGVEYNKFGDITKLPATDAGGTYPLSSTFYVNNQLDTQEQNGETIGYNLDPVGRPREVISTGKTAADVVQHYAGPGEEPAWTTNTGGETTRNIYGINGNLVAIQYNSETPILQIANLHGDLVATASSSETVTKLLSTYNTTEFGVPTTSLPPKYSWLGAIDLSTSELPSGTVAMGVRSYVPEVGRFLQPDPRPGGSANPYAYTFGDPMDQADPSGEWTFQTPRWLRESDAEWGEREGAAEAARLAAERAEAERIAQEAAEREAYYAAITASVEAGEPGLEEEWEWEEEGEYEYATYHKGGPSKEEAHIEPAILYQPLGEEKSANKGDGEGLFGLAGDAPLCKAGREGLCTLDTGGVGHHCYKKCKKHERREAERAHRESKQHWSCPPGWSKVPVVELCINLSDWPSGPSPAPSYPPPPEPVPAG